jgi:two-component system, OmpR family, sensor histidine kinase ArlS
MPAAEIISGLFTGWATNGKMNKKLLHKTSTAYLLYSVIILIIAAPVFYYATEKLYIQEADDTLRLHKKEFLKYTAPGLVTADIDIWNKFNRNIKIEPGSPLNKDSIYSIAYYDSLDNELEPYRELRASVLIKQKPYTYAARINLVETEDLIKNIAFLFLLVSAVLLIGLFIITKKLSLNLWKPFYKTLQQIEEFEIDKTRQPQFAKTGIEEFNRLNSSIQKLIKKNTAIYKDQKEFIENAAHELQTPLAVFQAKIDTLIQRQDVTKEQAGILNTLNDSVSRLNRLNKNLLLLSKIEHDNYSNKESIFLSALIEKNLDFFTEQAKAKQLIIQKQLEEELEISSNPVLAEVLMSNLFLNAIKHNTAGGKIIIAVRNNTLVFSNSGQPLPLDNNKLFNRFSKADPSGPGTGLGLSIVKKIAAINNWTVSYNFDNNLHSFTIAF